RRRSSPRERGASPVRRSASITSGACPRRTRRAAEVLSRLYASGIGVPARLRYLGHSPVLLELDGVRILTDPLLVDRIGPLHRHSDAADEMLEGIEADVVLISHAHHDHLHLPSLRRLRGRPDR